MRSLIQGCLPLTRFLNEDHRLCVDLWFYYNFGLLSEHLEHLGFCSLKPQSEP